MLKHSWSKLFSRFAKIFKISDQFVSENVTAETLKNLRISITKDLLIEFIVSWNNPEVSITSFKSSNSSSDDVREIDARWALIAISQKFFSESEKDFFNLFDVLEKGKPFYSKELDFLLDEIRESGYKLSFFILKRREK